MSSMVVANRWDARSREHQPFWMAMFLIHMSQKLARRPGHLDHHAILAIRRPISEHVVGAPTKKLAMLVRAWPLYLVATDHAPHSSVEKEVEFEEAAFGMIGLETAVPLLLELVRAGRLSPAKLIDRMSRGPAAAFGLPGGTLRAGAPGDVTVINPEAAWTCDPATLRSRSRNTPFAGRPLQGRAALTVVGGRIVFSAPDPAWQQGQQERQQDPKQGYKEEGNP
jgi:hypothetical protein